MAANHLLGLFLDSAQHECKRKECLLFIFLEGKHAVWLVYISLSLSAPPSCLMDYTELVIYLDNCCCPHVCTLFFFNSLLELSNKIGGSEAVAPHACFCLCGSHFCGKEIFSHKEHYVFTILFFPGLGRGLEPEWRWLSVAHNFLLVKKRDRFACSLFSFVTQVYAFQQAGLSVVRVVYQSQKGDVMLPPFWVAQSCFTGIYSSSPV